jgi:hypothetical protein
VRRGIVLGIIDLYLIAGAVAALLALANHYFGPLFPSAPSTHP